MVTAPSSRLKRRLTARNGGIWLCELLVYRPGLEPSVLWSRLLAPTIACCLSGRARSRVSELSIRRPAGQIGPNACAASWHGRG